MAGWEDLAQELDTWHDAGRTATFWWRDDDATRVTPALDRLLALGAETGTPVALAVIPRDINGDLRRCLAGQALASVLQHGWSHENHAPSDARQEEHGPHRPLEVMLDELAEGWRRIRDFEGGLPVLVAPWNRIDASLFAALPDIGLAAVSTLGPRDAAEPAPGVHRTNVHVDIIDWDGSRGFIGEHAVLDQFVRHLAARRRGEVDVDEPTGLMTHHLCHDEGCWSFIATVLSRTRSHPAVRWLDGREAFWP